jgi:hypothetical protein
MYQIKLTISQAKETQRCTCTKFQRSPVYISSPLKLLLHRTAIDQSQLFRVAAKRQPQATWQPTMTAAPTRRRRSNGPASPTISSACCTTGSTPRVTASASPPCALRGAPSQRPTHDGRFSRG